MKPPVMQIRLAREQDDEVVGELLVRSFLDTYAKKMPEVVLSAKRLAELRDTAGKRAIAAVWVAEDGGEIVGTVTVWPPGAPGSEAWIAGAADLRQLAIAPSQKGKGTAQQLLDVAEAWARQVGATAMCLHVRRGAVGVANVYSRRGYEREPAGDLDFLPDIFLEAFALRLTHSS